MKKIISIICASVLALTAFTGCNTNNSSTGADSLSDKEIVVVSREDGSGTRGAFVELFGIEEKDADGNKVDNTTESAEITNSTSVMMTTVANNIAAIGYISLGSLNDTVKALKIDGAEATVENIKNGRYKISRPFNIVTKTTANEAANDFITFILSTDGQKVIVDNGYIDVEASQSYTAAGLSGKITVAGSSSVTPVMEKLKEAYIAINPNVEIEIQESDSSTGVNSAIDGTCDIGMASRELKESEIEKGVAAAAIAMDGIAVIVNKNCELSDIKSETIKSIYKGEISEWSEILK